MTAACAPTPPPVVCDSPPEWLRSQVVVIARWDYPDVTAAGEGVGLDLDARVSDGRGRECTDEPDWVSPISGATGIDNQVGAYVVGLLSGGAFGQFTASQTATGQGLYAVEIDVALEEAGTTRASVALLRLGPVPGGPAEIMDGRLVAGQEFVLHERTAARRLSCASDAILVSFGDLDLPVGAPFGLLQLRDATFRLTPASDGAISFAEVGGAVGIRDLVPVFELALAGTGFGVDELSVRSIARPDLAPDGTGSCRQVSLGATVELVPATVTE